MKYLIAALLFVAAPVMANEVLEFGGGVGTPSDGRTTNYEYDGVVTGDDFNLLGGIGYYRTENRTDSLYLRSGYGLVVNPTKSGDMTDAKFYPSVYLGPAYIVRTDNVSTSNAQLVAEGNLMFVDNRYMGIGLYVKRFTNIGLNSGSGRNFIGLRIQWR